ncbi:hypothetical protein AUK40_03480 [Candidatus Wirthbacteria bacterium CG2_30_54_11]|uniref:Uncharacterized protein n=1 Tax=Candidatus Wirthbacteria bacterium CG2_30_54_11 TaxID=1817892 RepID=A0A1J5IYG0_9BACT|nr:MAG: hypothetical protein AUK40_03480 [Candidatus Wirthbacteria bacterium CG2_30_54_11]
MTIIPKTMRDISGPTRHPTLIRPKGRGQPLKYSTFVLSEIRSPQEIKIDRQLQSIFNRLNQSYSTSINTPHTAFLREQIEDFLHLSQTRYLFQSQTRAEPPEYVPDTGSQTS